MRCEYVEGNGNTSGACSVFLLLLLCFRQNRPYVHSRSFLPSKKRFWTKHPKKEKQRCIYIRVLYLSFFVLSFVPKVHWQKEFGKRLVRCWIFRIVSLLLVVLFDSLHRRKKTKSCECYSLLKCTIFYYPCHPTTMCVFIAWASTLTTHNKHSERRKITLQKRPLCAYYDACMYVRTCCTYVW